MQVVDAVASIAAIIPSEWQWVARAYLVARAVYGAVKARKIGGTVELRDHTVIVRSATEPQKLIYGRAVVSGPLTYACNSGPNNEWLHMVIPLAGHECDAIEEVYFNDEALGTLDGNGYVTQGRFYKGQTTATSKVLTITGPGNYNLDHTPAPGVSVNVMPFPFNEEPRPVYHVNGQTLVVDQYIGDPAQFIVYYSYKSGNPYARVRKYLGAPGQQADAELVAASAGAWTGAHRGDGICYLIVSLKFDSDVYAQGLPNIKARVRGKKVLDPRNGATQWTDNAALCCRDYLMGSYGIGATESEVDSGTCGASANISDESVSYYPPGTTALAYQKRYLCNGVITLDQTPRSIMEQLLTSMAGTCTYSAGQYAVWAGAYSAPVLTLGQDDLAGDVSVTPTLARRDLFNAVKGTYVDPAKFDQGTDFPIVRNDYYAQRDGGVIEKDITLTFTNDPTASQRIAKIILEAARQALTVQATFKLTAFRLRVNDIVNLNLPDYGFTPKSFRVMEWHWAYERGVTLLLKEEAQAIYDWANGEQTRIDLAPNTTLANAWERPVIGPLSLSAGTAELVLDPAGTVISRISVTWAQATSAYVLNGGRIDVEYQDISAHSGWLAVPSLQGDATQAYISPVQDKHTYNVRARMVSSMGVGSDWVYRDIIVTGQSAPPSNVASINYKIEALNLRLFWPGVKDLDLAGYELRYDGDNWDAAMLIAQVGSGANDYVWQFLRAGTTVLRIKALDKTGNYSTNEATVNVVIRSPKAPSVDSNVIDNYVNFYWQDCKTDVPISRYECLRGDDLGHAESIGSWGSDAFFGPIFEQIGGTYTYWIRAWDVADNVGEATRIVAIINQPPDYKLVVDLLDAFAGTKYQCVVEDGMLLAPINTTITWAQHFETRGWQTVDDQIAAGYPLYCQPTEATNGGTLLVQTPDDFPVSFVFPAADSTSFYEFEYDYGTTVTTGIAIRLQTVALWGSVTIGKTISYKTNAGDVWTSFNGRDQVSIATFRYVKIRLDFVAANDASLIQIEKLRLLLSAKKKRDEVFGHALASDAQGTIFPFKISFYDVETIVATPMNAGGISVTAEVNFQDIPEPTYCRVLLFNSQTGARVSGDVSLNITGF